MQFPPGPACWQGEHLDTINHLFYERRSSTPTTHEQTMAPIRERLHGGFLVGECIPGSGIPMQPERSLRELLEADQKTGNCSVHRLLASEKTRGLHASRSHKDGVCGLKPEFTVAGNVNFYQLILVVLGKAGRKEISPRLPLRNLQSVGMRPVAHQSLLSFSKNGKGQHFRPALPAPGTACLLHRVLVVPGGGG